MCVNIFVNVHARPCTSMRIITSTPYHNQIFIIFKDTCDGIHEVNAQG